MTDFVKKTLKEIESRRRELEPLVEEYRQLEEAAAALEGLDGGGQAQRRVTSPSPARRRAGGTTAGAATTTRGSSRRRGRPRGSGKRAQQALDLVKNQPGITIPELAKAMSIQPNYLYRVLPSLEQDGKVRRKDKGWYPA